MTSENWQQYTIRRLEELNNIRYIYIYIYIIRKATLSIDLMTSIWMEYYMYKHKQSHNKAHKQYSKFRQENMIRAVDSVTEEYNIKQRITIDTTLNKEIKLYHANYSVSRLILHGIVVLKGKDSLNYTGQRTWLYERISPGISHRFQLSGQSRILMSTIRCKATIWLVRPW